MDQYVIRIDGALPDDALAGFAELSVTAQPVQTVLQGRLPDQAALAGVLDHLDELGVVILEVFMVPTEESHNGRDDRDETPRGQID